MVPVVGFAPTRFRITFWGQRVYCFTIQAKSPRVGVEPTCCNTHGRTELNRPASWDMERIPGLEPRTARRQRAVLPLNYIRMEEGWGLAPQAVKLNLFSRQLQYACLLNLPNGRGGGIWTHNLALIRDLLKPLKLLHNIVVFNFQCSKWCRGLESNQGHPRLQRGALPWNWATSAWGVAFGG